MPLCLPVFSSFGSLTCIKPKGRKRSFKSLSLTSFTRFFTKSVIFSFLRLSVSSNFYTGSNLSSFKFTLLCIYSSHLDILSMSPKEYSHQSQVFAISSLSEQNLNALMKVFLVIVTSCLKLLAYVIKSIQSINKSPLSLQNELISSLSNSKSSNLQHKISECFLINHSCYYGSVKFTINCSQQDFTYSGASLTYIQ